MRSIKKYALGTAIAVAGLTTLGLAHDSHDGRSDRHARREHRAYHKDMLYEHYLYHQEPHSRRDHRRFHRELEREHRDFHRDQRWRDRYDDGGYYRNDRRYDGRNYYRNDRRRYSDSDYRY